MASLIYYQSFSFVGLALSIGSENILKYIIIWTIEKYPLQNDRFIYRISTSIMDPKIFSSPFSNAVYFTPC